MSFSVVQHLFGPIWNRKARPGAVPSSGVLAPRRRLACSQPPSFDPDTSKDDTTRRTEKEMLQTLNDRFAGYIDKVRYLETHNRNLEAEAEALRQNRAGRASVDEQYERELEELRGLLVQLTGEKASLALEHDHLEDSIHQLTARLEDELRHREELEAAARAMQRYVEECRLARLELDRKMRGLEEEESFLKKNHEEEVSELLAQIQGAQISFDLRSAQRADITGALREIRAQLDSHATESSTQAEEWFKVRVEHLSDAARSNQHALNETQEEIGDYRRQLQSRTIELETLRATKESLERQRVECEESNHDELNSLQETINQLDHELKTTKWEMANQLREYQELLNVKMALDIEIAAYRKLLEGEENRFVSGGGPYSYPLHRIASPFKLKGEEISDTVIVEEQTDETQVTEVTEEAEEEEEENQEEEEEEGGVSEDIGGGKEENGAEKEEVKLKYPEKSESPPLKSPQPNSPAANSPVSKSPAAKSPVLKPPEVKLPAEDESKSPVSKSPDSESHLPRTPEPSPPEKEKAKSPSVTDLTKELKNEDSFQLVKDEKIVNEKEPENQQPEKIDSPDPKKENNPANAPKPCDILNAAEDKPAPKPKPNDSEAKETSSAPVPDKTQPKVEAEGKPATKEEPETKPAAKEEPETKPAAKEEPETKPAAKEEPETKPAAKEEPETKPAAKEEPETKPAAKEEPETKPAAKEEPETKPAAKEPETKPAAKEPETKPAAKEEPEGKPAAKEEPETKPAAKEEPETKPAAKEEPETKPAAKEEPETKPAAKEEPETKPAAKEEPETKPAAKEEPETKPAAKEPETKPAAKEEPETKPAAKEEPETKPAAKEEPETKPAAKEEPETKPAAKEEPQTKPAAKEQPETKPAAKEEPKTKPATKEEPETKPAAKEEPEVNPNSKADADVKPSPKIESQKIDNKVENQKPGEIEKAKPEQADNLKEKKKDTGIEERKEAEKAEKSSSTESKEFKDEKTSQ